MLFSSYAAWAALCAAASLDALLAPTGCCRCLLLRMRAAAPACLQPAPPLSMPCDRRSPARSRARPGPVLARRERPHGTERLVPTIAGGFYYGAAGLAAGPVWRLAAARDGLRAIVTRQKWLHDDLYLSKPSNNNSPLHKHSTTTSTRQPVHHHRMGSSYHYRLNSLCIRSSRHRNNRSRRQNGSSSCNSNVGAVHRLGSSNLQPSNNSRYNHRNYRQLGSSSSNGMPMRHHHRLRRRHLSSFYPRPPFNNNSPLHKHRTTINRRQNGSSSCCNSNMGAVHRLGSSNLQPSNNSRYNRRNRCQLGSNSSMIVGSSCLSR
jgi:hypothetical protein